MAGPDVAPDTDMFVGPDVIARDIDGIRTVVGVDSVRALSFSVTACNVGDTQLLWYYWGGVGDVLTPAVLGGGVAGRGGNVTWTLDGTHYHPLMVQNIYRLRDGRFEQLGYSWAKHAFATDQDDACVSDFGPCDPGVSTRLGVGCSDTYSFFTNADQTLLGPRFEVRASTGLYPHPFTDSPAPTTAVSRRLQVRLEDLIGPLADGPLFVAEAQLVTRDDAYWGNSDNNACYRLASIQTPGSLSFFRSGSGSLTVRKPAIYAWQDHGLGIEQPDPGVRIEAVDVPDDGRFHVGSKVIDEGSGAWRYEYAVHNMNSDRAAGGFIVPIPSGVNVGAIGFKDVDRHSGEELVYDNTDWAITSVPGQIRWSAPETYDVNPNSNALRWGFLYNFWFVADAPPSTADATLSIFQPSATHPNAMVAHVHAPASPCPCEVDGDQGQVDVFDLLAYLDLWFADADAANLDDLPGVDVFDLLHFLDCWFAASDGSGCP